MKWTGFIPFKVGLEFCNTLSNDFPFGSISISVSVSHGLSCHQLTWRDHELEKIATVLAEQSSQNAKNKKKVFMSRSTDHELEKIATALVEQSSQNAKNPRKKVFMNQSTDHELGKIATVLVERWAALNLTLHLQFFTPRLFFDGRLKVLKDIF